MMSRALQTSASSARDWLSCCRLEYTLEVMKNGQIMENKAVHEKAHYTFGRSPGSDVVLEHPSSSGCMPCSSFAPRTGRRSCTTLAARTAPS